MDRPEPDKPHLIYTYSGRLVDPWDLRPEDVDITDIALSLYKIPRFNGHSTFTLDVAAHCVEVAHILEAQGHHPIVCLTGLLHDASEAYLCDIPAPIKRRPEMYPYRLAEARAQQAIATRFGLPFPFPAEVHDADRSAYYNDRTRRTCTTHPISPPRPTEFFTTAFYRYDAERRKA